MMTSDGDASPLWLSRPDGDNAGYVRVLDDAAWDACDRRPLTNLLELRDPNAAHDEPVHDLIALYCQQLSPAGHEHDLVDVRVVPGHERMRREPLGPRTCEVERSCRPALELRRGEHGEWDLRPRSGQVMLEDLFAIPRVPHTTEFAEEIVPPCGLVHVSHIVSLECRDSLCVARGGRGRKGPGESG